MKKELDKIIYNSNINYKNLLAKAKTIDFKNKKINEIYGKLFKKFTNRK